MLVKNLSCPNQENTNYTYRLPFNMCCPSDTLGINFVICDDTANKSKVIYDKCSKDHKCEIDDETKNELKKNIKSELEKDLKCEFDDKTKNELKKNIKSELEKDLKCEFDDKTKNELKKNIKSELEKDLKCEFDDKTKNELKDKIKKEIKDEIDCKCDQDKTSDEEKDKDKGKDKDKDKDEIADDESEGAIESKLIDEGLKVNCPAYKSDSMNKPGWFTRDLLKQFLPDLMISKKITDHFGEKSVEQYYAENFAITFKCEEDAKCGSNVNFTWDVASNMWCNKEGKQGNAWELCPKDFLKGETSVCCPSGSKASTYAENFFLNNKCPNLILDLKGKELEECAGKTIVAKLESPLIILDPYGRIIDKNGNNTEIYYSYLKPFLNPDGTMKDCGSNAKCQEYAKMIDKILWTSDKEVTLKIPDNLGEKSLYSPSVGNNQDEAFSSHDYVNDLI